MGIYDKERAKLGLNNTVSPTSKYDAERRYIGLNGETPLNKGNTVANIPIVTKPPSKEKPVVKKSLTHSRMLDVTNIPKRTEDFAKTRAGAFTLNAADALLMGIPSAIDKKTNTTQNLEAFKSHPIASGAGQIAGSLLPFSMASKGVGLAIKGSKLAPRLTRDAIAGAGVMGVQGAIQGEDAGQIAKDVAIGTVFGIGADLGMTAVFKAVGNIAKKYKVSPQVINDALKSGDPKVKAAVEQEMKSDYFVNPQGQASQNLADVNRLQLPAPKQTVFKGKPMPKIAPLRQDIKPVDAIVPKETPIQEPIAPEPIQAPKNPLTPFPRLTKSQYAPAIGQREAPFTISTAEKVDVNSNKLGALPLKADKPKPETITGVLPKANKPENFAMGEKVIGIERGNQGSIAKDFGDGSYLVHFYNKETGKEALIKMQRSEFEPIQKTIDKVVEKNPRPPKYKIDKPLYVNPTEPNKLKSAWDKFYTKGFDNQAALGRATKGLEMPSDKDIKTMGSNARNVKGTVEYVFQDHLVDMEGKKLNDNSLEKILNTSKLEQDAYNDYLLHKHNIQRFQENKPIFLGDGVNPTITDEASKKIVANYEKTYPGFKEKSNEINDFNGKIIDEWTVKSGLITQEFGDLLKKMYPNYVPTLREGSVVGDRFAPKGLKANSGIKQAVGGNKPIMAINKSYPIMVQKVMKAARQNELYKSLLETVEKYPEQMSTWAKVVDDNAGKVANADLTKTSTEALQKDGIDAIDNLSNKMLEIDERNGKYFVTAMREGKPIRMEVHKDLFDAFKTLNKSGSEGTLDDMAAMLRYATNPFKALITGYNPFFALRNISRDLPTSYIQGTENNPIKWFKNLLDAGKSMVKKDEAYNEFMALGGKKTGFFNNEKGLVPIGKTKKVLRKIGEGIQGFNEFTETLPRYGEYLGTLKREGTSYAAKQKAIYNSGEVTVNFGRSGDVTKAIDSAVPYLNPAMQGVDKSIRALQKGSTWAKGVGAITVPASILYAINNSTPEAARNYEQLDNRTKDNYYVIPIGEGKYIKIPKSRESGVIFGSLFERLTRLATGKQDSFKGYGNTVATNFAPNNPLQSNLFAPATLNLATNKDFANRSIVPLNMTKDGFGDARSKYLQYDETTSEIAKWFGETASKAGINNGEGFSPKVIDYLISSYTGIIGSVLTSSTTKGGNVIEKVLTKPFTADNLYNNNIQNDFYDRMNQLKKLKSDKNILEKIPSKTVTLEEKKLSVYNKAAGQMSALRKQEKLLNQQPDSPGKDVKLRALRQKILDIAKNTI
ncbi:MAG: LPD38 domain-containing protein [Bacteroidota bacterium]